MVSVANSRVRRVLSGHVEHKVSLPAIPSTFSLRVKEHTPLGFGGGCDANRVGTMVLVLLGVGGEDPERAEAIQVSGLFVLKELDTDRVITGETDTVGEDFLGDDRGRSLDCVRTAAFVERVVVFGDGICGDYVILVNHQASKGIVVG